MATFASTTAVGTRHCMILAAAIALLLPPPARCASCATGNDRCPSCATHAAASGHVAEFVRNSDSHEPTHACCRRNVESDSTPSASTSTNSVQPSQHACGCGVHSAPRTVPPVAKALASPDLNAEAIVAVDLPRLLAATGPVTADFVLSDAPLIPHRILHCSWII
jgi:hypothetical protein